MNSFLHGKTTLTAPGLRLPPGLAAAHSSGPLGALPRAKGAALAPTGHNGANIEVIKEGDKVVRLVVTCTCGERVEIECLYPAS